MKKGLSKYIFFIVAGLLLCLFITYLVNIEIQYKKAVVLFDTSSDFEDTEAAFVALGNYRDSVERAEEARQKRQAVDEVNQAIIEANQARAQLIAEFANAISLFEKSMFEEAMKAFEELIQFVDPEGRTPANYLPPQLVGGETITSEMLFQEAKYQFALKLMVDNDYENAAMFLYDLGNYKDSATLYTETLLYYMPEVQRRAYEEAVLLMGNMQYTDALERFKVLASLNYEPAKEKIDEIIVIIERLGRASTISAGNNHSVGITNLSLLRATGVELYWKDIVDWNSYDVISIAAGGTFTIGLCRSGNVVLTGVINTIAIDSVNWENIVAIAAGEAFGIGLRADGRVESFGHDAGDGQRSVSEWVDIIEIATGVRHTVGLRADGSVVITGFNAEQQQEALNAQLDHNNPVKSISAGGVTQNRICRQIEHQVQ